MIKALELRIGSRAMVYGTNGSPTDWKEISLNTQHIAMCSDYPQWFMPVPITEMRLKEFSCKQNKKDPFLWRTPDGLLFTFRSVDNVIPVKIELKMVKITAMHIFQNYVSITGEQLIIK